MIPRVSKEELNKIFAMNLNRLMEKKDVKAVDISNALGLSYMTVSDWVNGKSIPRMDKMEMLAYYFDVSKAELIEVQNKDAPAQGEGDDVIAAYLGAREQFSDDDMEDIKMFIRMKKERNKAKREHGK